MMGQEEVNVEEKYVLNTNPTDNLVNELQGGIHSKMLQRKRMQ
jgi:hypothetical protein